jgi:hypothetical protein
MFDRELLLGVVECPDFVIVREKTVAGRVMYPFTVTVVLTKQLLVLVNKLKPTKIVFNMHHSLHGPMEHSERRLSEMTAYTVSWVARVTRPIKGRDIRH